jgi:hypothetical protein
MEDFNKYYDGLGESYAIKLLDKEYMENCTLRKLQCHEFNIYHLKRYQKKRFPFDERDEFKDLENMLTQLNDYKNQHDINLHKELCKRERTIFERISKKNVIKTIEDFDLYYKEILEKKQNNSKEDAKEYKKNYMRNYMKTSPYETCICGSEVNIYKKTQHLNTKKHKNFVANME